MTISDNIAGENADSKHLTRSLDVAERPRDAPCVENLAV